MYIPESFRETDLAALHGLIRDYGFATVITQQDGAPYVSHLPLLLDPERGACGTLVGHLARANPQWRHFEAGQEVLAIFHGPHGYVSPAWYTAGPWVPTWNYAVVHARGTPRLLEDEAALVGLLARLTAAHESRRETGWEFAIAPERRAAVLAAIVGFEIPIARIDGKFKLSQNRPPAERTRVTAALADGGPLDAALAALMRGRGP